MFANAIYLLALTFASPWILYRRFRHGRYRRGFGQKFLGLGKQQAAVLRSDKSRCVWVHAVSVGEVNLLPDLVQRLQATDVDLQIVISSSTDTGYDLAVKHFGADRVFFCPLDFTWAVTRTLKHLQAERLVLTELELWPNLIAAAHQLGCPVTVVNARLSEKSSSGYQRFSFLTKSTFAKLDCVACQDQSTADNFAACGTLGRNIHVTGSLKFDGAPQSRNTPQVRQCQQWAGIQPDHQVWLVGSTQVEEETLALKTYQSLRQEHHALRLIIVPRHPERFQAVAEMIASFGMKIQRRSIDEAPLSESQWTNDTVILIDTVGELRHWWGVCQIATVGGSFGDRGGQNMLEPAGYGCAVSFGPNTRNFKDIANRLIQAGAAVRVHDQAQLKDFVVTCLTDSSATRLLGHAASQMVNEHRGAIDRTMQLLVASENKNPLAAATTAAA